MLRRVRGKDQRQPFDTGKDLFCEALGICLARYFGVPTPEPAIITLSTGFVLTANKMLARENISLRPGHGFGTKVFDLNYRSVKTVDDWESETVAQAGSIFGFDMLVMNGDRKATNPNYAKYQNSLLAYDFGLSFCMVGALRACEVSKTNCAKTHVFYDCLKKTPPNWEDFENKLASLSEGMLVEMIKTFPPEWLSLQSAVFDYLLEASEKSVQFCQILRESLQ